MKTFEAYVFIPYGGQIRLHVEVDGDTVTYSESSRAVDYYFDCNGMLGGRNVTVRDHGEDDQVMYDKLTPYFQKFAKEKGKNHFTLVNHDDEDTSDTYNMKMNVFGIHARSM